MAIKRTMPPGYKGGSSGGGPQRFTGISSDPMPAAGEISKYPDGSTLHFVDTGEDFVWHDGMWEEDVRLQTALKNVI